MGTTTINLVDDEQTGNGCDCLDLVIWNPTVPSVMQFLGESGGIIDEIQVGIGNVNGLTSNLANKETRIFNLEGLEMFSIPANQTIELRDRNGNVLSVINVSYLNSSSTLTYNATNETLELRDELGNLISEIPVSSLVSNLANAIHLGGNVLTLRDVNGNILSTVSFNIGNIGGLQTELNRIESLIPTNLSELNNDAGFITMITVSNDNTNPTRHQIATVEGVILEETVTQLEQPEFVNNILYLKYRNENNVLQTLNVNLSGLLTVDINLQNATYNASTNRITLTETDGQAFIIDLSEFSIIVTTNPDGSVNLIQEGVTKITISKVGISGQWTDLLNKPATFPASPHTHSYNTLTDLPILDNELKVYQIPVSELSATPTDETINALVAEWFNSKGYMKTEIQTIAWETTGIITVTVTYMEDDYVNDDYVD